MLKIKNLHASINNKKILNGINLTLKPGEIHVLMGPNGSGKSSLAKILAGHQDFDVSLGTITLDGKNLLEAAPDIRSEMGLFLAFQYPLEVPGVNLRNFLRLAYNTKQPELKKLPVFAFKNLMREKAKLLELDETLLERNLNEGMSGGEKKKCEILQLAVLEPHYAILDETDSGLDLDALKTVFSALKKLMKTGKRMGILVITHYQRIFEYIKPDKVHIMLKGSIVDSGDYKIVKKLLKSGYKHYT